MISSYAAYHARDWADGKTDAEIKDEIARVAAKISHTYQWNEMGCAFFDYSREETLKQILEERHALRN